MHRSCLLPRLLVRRPPANPQRYLVTETDEGVTIIDQHALHERILFEQLRQALRPGRWKAKLLVPEPVDLSPAETAAALSIATAGRVGREDRTVRRQHAVGGRLSGHAGQHEPIEVLRALLEQILSEAKRPTAAICWTICCTRSRARRRSSRRPTCARGDYGCWSSVTWSKTPITVRTAARRRSCSRGRIG